MNIQKEELLNCQVQLTVEVNQDRVEQAMRGAAQRLGKRVRVPGFRPGKAPYRMIVQHVGESAVMEEALEEMMPEVLADAIQEAGIEVYAPDYIEPHLESVSPLVFRFVIPTPPVVKLGDTGAIEVDAREVEIGDEAIDEVLNNLKDWYATLEPSLGPAAYGDRVTFDLEGQLMDGTNLEEQKGVELTLVEASAGASEEGEEADPQPVPDLPSQIVGMMVNQVKESAISYPAEWPEARLQGRTVLYKITLLDVKKRSEPELDDDFAQDVGDFDTLDALRDQIRDNLRVEKEDEEFERQVNGILDALVDESELDYPDLLVEGEVARRIASLERQLAPYQVTVEQYLQTVDQTMDDLKDQMWDEAEQFVRRSLVITEYVRERELSVSDEDVERELDLILAEYEPEAAQELRARIRSSEDDLKQVRDRLLTRKAIFTLHHEVTGEEMRPLFPAAEEQTQLEAGDDPAAEEATEHPAEQVATRSAEKEDPEPVDEDSLAVEPESTASGEGEPGEVDEGPGVASIDEQAAEGASISDT